MKTLFKYAAGFLLAGSLMIGMTPVANAQRGFHGGGGVHVGGGVGFGGFHGAVGFRSGSNLAVTARPGYYGGYYGGTLRNCNASAGCRCPQLAQRCPIYRNRWRTVLRI